MNTFNGAVREAVSRRHQWRTPIAIWIWADDGNMPPALGFYARAQSVPPARADDEVVTTLSDETLTALAGMLDDAQAFDAFVTDILADAEAHGRRVEP